MIFDSSTYQADVPALFRRFLDIAPWPIWDRRFEKFDSWSKSNPLLPRFIEERYPLECQMRRIRMRPQNAQQISFPISDSPSMRFLSFVATTSRVHQRLNDKGRSGLERMIVDGLKDEKGLGPLAFELALATRIMSRDWDVTFHDLEQGGGYDFLVERNGCMMEVECKHFSADIGRQIHRRRLYDLLGDIHSVLARAADGRRNGLLLMLTLAGRLPRRKNLVNELEEIISSCLESGAAFKGPDPCSIEVSEFELRHTPFENVSGDSVSSDALERFIEKEANIVNKNAFVVGNRNAGVVVIVFASQKQDRVLHAAIERLKDSSRDQLTGEYPGVLCVHLEDVTGEELQDLATAEEGTPTPIQIASSHLLIRRPNVHSLIYFSPAELAHRKLVTTVGSQSAKIETGPIYVFRNENHPSYLDQRCELLLVS